MSDYTIDQFSQITGLNKILIRTWENRYQFVTPKRSDTNIRMYDDQIVTKGIKYSILTENGHKISKLISLNDQEINSIIEETLDNTDNETKISIYISNFIEAGLFFNQKLFNDTYKECYNKLGIEKLYTEVLMDTMNRIGILWLNSQISPANEHFISENIRIKISSEIESQNDEPSKKNKWILYLPENEYHDIGLLFAYLLLKTKGHPVIYLGQNLPKGSLNEFKNNKYNLLSFFISNKSEEFISETTNFLYNNFRDSQVNIISKNLEFDKKFKNIKNIGFKEFVNEI